jgi:nicotinate-nucleotide adenylyltransferase
VNEPRAAQAGGGSGPRVGLLGGTFDPPHRAHLALAHAALQSLALEQVRWVPTGQPWYKVRAVSAAEHRIAMVCSAIAGEPRFALERIEVDRPGASYTVDTLTVLHAREPQVRWVLILGADQFARLATWHRWREVVQLATLAVADRPGDTVAPPPEVKNLPHERVPLPALAVSASDIRARVAAGRDICELVPPEVARYIARRGLYR